MSNDYLYRNWSCLSIFLNVIASLDWGYESEWVNKPIFHLLLLLDVIACIWHLVLIWSFSSSVKTFLDIHLSHTPYTIECLKIPKFCREVHWAPKTPYIHYTFPPSLIFKLTIIHFYFSYTVKSKNRSPSYKNGLNSVHSGPIWPWLGG